MTLRKLLPATLAAVALIPQISCTSQHNHAPSAANTRPRSTRPQSEMAQVPTWSRDDLEFFLHGSMSTEVVPEKVLRAFIQVYPDLFPAADLSNFGLMPDATFGWPVGFSAQPVKHLAGLKSLGVNCAACHSTDIIPVYGGPPVRVLGVTSHFDAEAYFGAVVAATFRTATPENMKKFLTAFLLGPGASGPGLQTFDSSWEQHQQKITDIITADPWGSKEVAPGELHDIQPSDVKLDLRFSADEQNLATVSHSVLKLFHNMRASLHIPDQPLEKAPPASGPGRNDAFGLLSGALFGAPQPSAPVKYGLVWNVDRRQWVHWDGNTRSPIGRNLLASLGLGAPLVGKHGELDFAMIKRQTDKSETIRPPRYPFAIDQKVAERGAAHYRAQCAVCHDGPEGDNRLYAVTEVGTEPRRALSFTQEQADRFNKFLSELETPGYQPAEVPGLRSTQKYWAASLAGVWARSPYLHNGSVRTMAELLTTPESRAKSFHRGSRVYDPETMGCTDAGSYLLDTTSGGSANSGHDYGSQLSPTQKKELIEYLKTL